MSSTLNAYDFWTFVFFKTIIICFLVVIFCSLLGGFFTKQYFKHQYSQLKRQTYNDHDVEYNTDEHETQCDFDGELLSDRTSVTFMPFDHSQWKRKRASKLKKILLKPRKLNTKLYNVKSLPTSPFRPRHRTYAPYRSKYAKGIAHSLSDTNILTTRRPRTTRHLNPKRSKQSDGKKSLHGNAQIKPNAFQFLHHGSNEPVNIDSDFFKSWETSEHSNNFPREKVAEIGATTQNKEQRRANDKMLKDVENMKRRVTAVDYELDENTKPLREKWKNCSPGGLQSSQKDSTGQQNEMENRHKISSQLSISTIQSDKTSSKFDLDTGTDQEFEMDYFDYDVGNVGNIPGSYFGLEPSFVLWNSEVCNVEEQEENDAEMLIKVPPLATDELDTNLDDDSLSQEESVKMKLGDGVIE